MAQDEKGRRGGTSKGESSPTARPSSVGPHHRDRDQEDPANPGIRPEQGYGAEITRNRDAAERAPGQAPVSPSPKTETADESGGTEEMQRRSGPSRDAPPMRGTTKE